MDEISINYTRARQSMVENQLLPGGVREARLCKIMGDIPREAYLPDELRPLAYMDKDISLACGALLAPLTFALLAELAAVQENELVLDIACATGYSTAVLAALGNTVVGLEENADLTAQASQTLATQNIDNAVIVNGNHAEGQAAQSPYDVIFINGFVPKIHPKLSDQMAENGRLVCITQDKGALCGVCLTRQKGGISRHIAFERTAPLVAGFMTETGFSF